MKVVYSIVSLAFIFFCSADFVEAQNCKQPSVSTEKNIMGNKKGFFFNKIYEVEILRLKFPLPYKIPAIMEIYPISDIELEFESIQDKERTNLLKKVASNEKFEFCVDNLPKGSYLLKIGDAKGSSSMTMLRIRITDNGSKKTILVQ